MGTSGSSTTTTHYPFGFSASAGPASWMAASVPAPLAGGVGAPSPSPIGWVTDSTLVDEPLGCCCCWMSCLLVVKRTGGDGCISGFVKGLGVVRMDKNIHTAYVTHDTTTSLAQHANDTAKTKVYCTILNVHTHTDILAHLHSRPVGGRHR